MEKLTEQQRESVKKLSTERLRVNLIRADYAEDEVMKMDRQMLMETWAKLVALGKTGPTEGAAAAAYDPVLEKERLEFEKIKWEKEQELQKQKLELEKMKLEKEAAQREKEAAQRVKEKELEKERLEFEKKKYEEQKEREKKEEQERLEREKERKEREQKEEQERKEREQKEEQERKEREQKEEQERLERIEFEKKRYEDELKLREEELRLREEEIKKEKEKEEQLKKDQKERWEFEKKKWDDELKLREKQQKDEIKIKEATLKIQSDKEIAEKAKEDAKSAKVKRYGDAIRNSITRQSNDPIEAITFFRNAEALFDTLEVPDDIKGVIIRPYLNDRAKALVARLDDKQAANYKEIKSLILKEYKLTPATYREKFNELQKDASETFVMFRSRLKALLSSYLESRSVKTYDELQDLILCDRVRSTLHPACLNYILSIEAAEASGWIGSKKLAEAVDAYYANRIGDKVRTGAVGFSSRNTDTSFKKSYPPKPHGNENAQSGTTAPGTGSKTEKSRPDAACFICGSKTHFRRDCPQYKAETQTEKSPGYHGGKDKHKPTWKVSKCAADVRTLSEFGQPVDEQVQVAKGAESVEESTNHESAVPESDLGPSLSACKSVVNDVSVPTCVEAETYDISKLHYVDVGVSNRPDGEFISVSALEDSGSQIAVANKQLIDKLDDIDVIGSVKIRGVIGDGINCALVRMHVCLWSAENDCKQRSIPITCAVSEAANDMPLLPAEVVERSNALRLSDNDRNGDDNDNDKDDSHDDSNDDETDNDDDMNDACDENGDEVSKTPTTHVNVVTRSGHNYRVDDNVGDNIAMTDNDCVSLNDNQRDDIDRDIVNSDSVSDIPVAIDVSSSTRDALIKAQRNDPSLSTCWKLSEKGKGGFVVENGVLMRKDKILGQEIKQLVLPQERREHVLELGHGLCGAHMAWRNTSNRIRLNFWWPTIRADVIKWCANCDVCQHKARVTCWDRVPIQPIPRAEVPFSHWFMDVGGPLSSEKLQYNYFLVMCDSCTRFPVAFALRSVTSKSICDCLLSLFQFVGTPTWISCDNASYNVSGLTQELMKRVGCSPRFITPGHSQADGLAERLVGTTKSLIAKVASEHPKSWHKLLGYVMWALREVPNETTHVPPALLAFGRVPRGPLAILKETWCGEREFPPGIGKGPLEYLKELRENLEIALNYASSHAEPAQQRYAERHNQRSREKKFAVGDEVLILKPDSTTSRVFSRWKGPAKIISVVSPHSYIVELDGTRSHLHANYLRKYNVHADEINYDSSAFAADQSVVAPKEMEDGDICVKFCEAVGIQPQHRSSTCAIIHAEDKDFGAVQTPNTSRGTCGQNELPSQRIDPKALSHLDEGQKHQLLEILDRYADVFRDEPGLCTLVTHEIPLTAEFQPKRLRAYRIPERLQPEVDRQINELLDKGFIRRSNSPMASPLVCVLKGPNGRDGVRLAVDYRFINRYTVPDAFPVPDIREIIQRIGNSKFISVFDTASGFWQTPIKPEDQWKTGFVCGDELYEWTRTPFGMRSSGNTFCRAIQLVLKPIKEFAASYVDDMAVHSMKWNRHLEHIDRFLSTIRKAGLTLKLSKCRFALPEVKFCGQLVGSGTRRADPEKVAAVEKLQVPETKRHVRQILGFFAFFRENIPNFAALAKPLTDLTAKGVPNKVPWGQTEQCAFDALKLALIKATQDRLQVIDMSKPFNILVDASDHTVSSVLTQVDENGVDRPIAFHSQKLNKTQRNWSVVEKEAFSALSALRRYRHWVFGAKIVVYSDHNPLTFLTESAPKSAKLMRWALALQEYDVEFRYRAGKTHIVPDVLTRLVKN